MKLQRAICTGITAKTYVAIDHDKIYCAHTLSLYGSTGINATATVDKSISDLSNSYICQVSQSATTVTLTFPSPHYLGLVTGHDYVLISGTGITGVDGIYGISTVSSITVVAFTSPISQTISSMVCTAIPIKFFSSFVSGGAISASTQYVVTDSAPATIYIIRPSAYTAGTIILDVMQQGQH